MAVGEVARGCESLYPWPLLGLYKPARSIQGHESYRLFPPGREVPSGFL